MSKDVYAEIDRDFSRERLLKYTRKAFKLLPRLDKPRILDAGCGSGLPTIELAKLSNGTRMDGIYTLTLALSTESVATSITTCYLKKANKTSYIFCLLPTQTTSIGLAGWHQRFVPYGY